MSRIFSFALGASVVFCICLIIALVDVFKHDSPPPKSGKSTLVKNISAYGFGDRKQLLIFDFDIDEIDETDKIFSRMAWRDVDHTTLTYVPAGIEIKGSANRLQLNYAFEIWDKSDDAVECVSIETCEDSKAELFEFGEDYEDYVLRSGFYDPTFVRDVVPSKMKGGILQNTLVEVLFKRGETYTYEGVYILYPAIQRRVLEKRLNWDNKGKAKCDNVDAAALIGEYTNTFGGRKEPCEEFDLQVKMRYPKCDMDECLHAKTEKFFSLLTLQNNTPVQYDAQSFADTFFVEQFMQDCDFPTASQYFYVSPDNILHSGPRWDYDFYWRFAESGWDFTSVFGRQIDFWIHLGSHAPFIELIETQRQSTVRENNITIVDLITTRREQFKRGLFDRHLERWDPFGKQYVSLSEYMNYESSSYTHDNFGDELDYMQDYFETKAKWMLDTSVSGFAFKEKTAWVTFVGIYWYVIVSFVFCVVGSGLYLNSLYTNWSSRKYTQLVV